MRRITELNYELMSPPGKSLFAHGNHLIPFHLIKPFSIKLIQKIQNVSFNSHITIFRFTPSETIHSPKNLRKTD